MAIAEKILESKYGSNLIDHHTYVIVGDGCLMEGISHEAASLSGHLGLSKLIVLYDDNEVTIDGSTSLTISDDTLGRFNSLGWHTQIIDGHNIEAIDLAILEAKKEKIKPSIIFCKTTIGFGSPNKAGKSDSHGAPLGVDEIEKVRKKLKWDSPPFVIPEKILAKWRQIGSRNTNLRVRWEKSFNESIKTNELRNFIDKDLTDEHIKILLSKKSLFSKEKKTMATRKASQEILKGLVLKIPNLIGGSADLSGSNNTLVESHNIISKKKFTGNYIHWGVREHCMAGSMNGISLHGGFIPYGGSFLVFSDYMRPSIRLSALMKQRVIYVLSHDSIGLGEDGPTHQPVEHLSALRVIPNLYVFRPCDSAETAESWMLALERKDGPSVIALSRQPLPYIRSTEAKFNENYSSKGAYVVESEEGAEITIIASGSEVRIFCARTRD